MIPAPDPPLSDGIVTLRAWCLDDVPVLVECLDGDEEVARWLDMVPQPYDMPAARAWVDQAASYWREAEAAPFAIVAATTCEVSAALASAGSTSRRRSARSGIGCAGKHAAWV